jgi:hypothetical protein
MAIFRFKLFEMKYFFYGLILLSIIGCKQNENETKSPFDKSKYQTVYVGFLDKTIFFPKGEDFEEVITRI